MSFIDALLLGLVQGFSEFFPVSSSAHLKLAKWLLAIPDGEHLLYFDLVCHGGTLLALLFFLRKEIFEVLSSIRSIALYSLAILPLVPAYFFLKPLRMAASDPAYLGYCLIATASLLFVASRNRLVLADNGPTKWKDVLCIGVMQTMALIPGISRSGSTIATARLRGWDWINAARFSFLLAVPTILGGELLETMKLMAGHTEAAGVLPWSRYAAGFATSFGFGLIGVRFMFRIYERGTVRPFAWYCLAMGILALVIFHG